MFKRFFILIGELLARGVARELLKFMLLSLKSNKLYPGIKLCLPLASGEGIPTLEKSSFVISVLLLIFRLFVFMFIIVFIMLFPDCLKVLFLLILVGLGVWRNR